VVPETDAVAGRISRPGFDLGGRQPESQGQQCEGVIIARTDQADLERLTKGAASQVMLDAPACLHGDLRLAVARRLAPKIGPAVQDGGPRRSPPAVTGGGAMRAERLAFRANQEPHVSALACCGGSCRDRCCCVVGAGFPGGRRSGARGQMAAGDVVRDRTIAAGGRRRRGPWWPWYRLFWPSGLGSASLTATRALRPQIGRTYWCRGTSFAPRG